MKIRDPEPLEMVFKRALGWFEAFRKLGFSSDDIWIMFDGPHDNGTSKDNIQVLQILKAQGKEFKIGCGVVQSNKEELEKEWLKISEWWNSKASEVQRQIIYESIWSDQATPVMLTKSLIDKGIHLPGVEASIALRRKHDRY